MTNELAIAACLLSAACGGTEWQGAAGIVAQDLPALHGRSPGHRHGRDGGPRGEGGGASTVDAGSAVPSAQVLFTDAQGGMPSTEPHFALASLYSVWIDSRWAGLPAGVHVEKMEIVTPQGNVYETRSWSFGAGGQVACDAASAPGGCDAWDALLVSGTAIADYSMVGRWEVRAYLDQTSTPIGTGGFTLE